MKRSLSLIITLGLLALGAHAQDKQWDKYVPKDKRKDILKKAARISGMGAMMTGQYAIVFWVSEPVARMLVSEKIDKERITSEEAEEKYREFRPENGIAFLIWARRSNVKPFGGMKTSTLDDPLAKNEIFLQRAEDNKQFSRGEVTDHKFDVQIGGFFKPSEIQSDYIIYFQRTTREGSTLIQSLDDKIQIHFVLAGKKIVLDYKLKDLVTKLEDL